MILVVGDVMTDVIVRPHGPLAHGTDCPAEIETRPGGSGANVACWIAHLGDRVAFAGRVGRADAAAQQATLEAHGVLAHLAIDDATPTGSIVAVAELDGERSFYTDRGANLCLCEADLPESLLDGMHALHVSGHALATPGPRAAMVALMRAARDRGCRNSVDGGSRTWLDAVGPASFAAWTSHADTCFANAAEAALLQPVWQGRTLVITDGANGARAVSSDTTLHMRAQTVAVVDTIGAGDAFAAGFLVERSKGAGLLACLSAGVAAASRALAMTGGRPPISRQQGYAEGHLSSGTTR